MSEDIDQRAIRELHRLGLLRDDDPPEAEERLRHTVAYQSARLSLAWDDLAHDLEREYRALLAYFGGRVKRKG
jgi:hypothetical protein